MLKNKLKSFRHKYEMNQLEFAAFLGVNKSLYNRWERQQGQPNSVSMIKLAKKLGCKIDDLFEEVPD
ncbi:MAG: DNA-binding protein [Firmicutes bacterium]|nr:DNA-binding protein [Bacillota bacterium]